MRVFKIVVIAIAFTTFYSNVYSAATAHTDFTNKLTTVRTSLGGVRKNLNTLNKSLAKLKRKIKSTQIMQSSKLEGVRKIENIKKGSIIKLKYNQAELEKLAEGLAPAGQPLDGYGYKVANLQELTKVTESINTYASSNNLSIKVSVPTFTAIPSSKIKSFLGANGINISQNWTDLISTIKNEPDQNKAFEDKKFPPDFLKKLENLENSIKNKFNTIANTEAEENIKTKIFATQFNSSEYNVVEKIGTLTGKRLMVRSTGKEDTQTVANAGGNESVANVEPTYKDILRAMGIGKKEGQLGVVSSYFGKKSFSQRLGIGDRSLFQQEPLTPVLIQEMIGEKQGGETDINKIPRVGVMFSEEAEGGTYKTTKGTTGITVIQSTYGHNEAVVNGLVPVDTFYVTNDGYVYSALRHKTKRLVPSAKGGLEKIDNPKEIQDIPTLDYQTVLNLKLVAKTLEEYYGYPMDIEFVYDPNTKIINIVQARPITYKQNIPDPSYLKTVPKSGVSGVTIGAAGGSLRFINKKEQIIVSETLGQALSIYIDSTTAKEVQCVITGEMAPATSHEATTFRGEGIPVIYTNKVSDVNTLLEAPGFKVVIDPQQGAIVNWDGPETSLNTLLTSGKIGNGWINYPIPCQVSLMQEKLTKFKEPTKPVTLLVQKEIFESLSDEKYSDTEFKGEYENINIFKPSALLKIVKMNEDKAASKKALARIILLIQRKYAQIKKIKTPINKTLLQALDVTYNYIIKYSREVKSSIDKFEHASPQRLFAVRFLEAAIKQDPDLGEIINGYSFAKILELIKEEKKIKKGKPELTDESLQLYKMEKLAFVPILENKWKNFVENWQKIADPNKADPQISLINQFNLLIVMLGNINLLPIWLHTSFSKNYNPGNIKDTGVALLTEFNGAKDFIQELNTKMDDLNSLDVSGFEDPAKIIKAIPAFKASILDYFTSEEFLSKFNGTNNLGKLAGLKVMSHFVDKFDQIIKNIKSGQFEDKDRVKNEKQMLLYEFELLLKWITLLTENQIKALCPTDSNELKATPTQELAYYQLRNDIDFFKKWNAGDCIGVTEEKLKLNPNLFKTIFLQYLAVIQDCITQVEPNNLTPEQLKTHLFGSKDFNVSGFALGSKLQLSKNSIPKALEDAFTSIHQNLLVIISQITSTLGLDQIETPDTIKETKDLINKKNIDVTLPILKDLKREIPGKTIRGTERKFLFGIADIYQTQEIGLSIGQNKFLKNISLIGVDMDKNNLVYTYNMPLRGHSCFFRLIFDKNKNKALLNAEFVFQNEDVRMPNLENYLKGKKTKAPEISYIRGKGNKSIIYSSPIKLGDQWYSPRELLIDLEILGNLTLQFLDD